jgi:hypothetical protein
MSWSWQGIRQSIYYRNYTLLIYYLNETVSFSIPLCWIPGWNAWTYPSKKQINWWASQSAMYNFYMVHAADQAGNILVTYWCRKWAQEWSLRALPPVESNAHAAVGILKDNVWGNSHKKIPRRLVEFQVRKLVKLVLPQDSML